MNKTISYLILSAAISNISHAETIFKVRELSFGAGKFVSDSSRDIYLGTPNTFALDYKTDVTFNVDLICAYYTDFCFIFNNKVEGMSSHTAYKYVSWDFQTGLATPYIDLYYDHKSEHVLEEYRPAHSYPVQDSIVLRMKFIFSPRKYFDRKEI